MSTVLSMSAIVAELETAYETIRGRHPEVPPALIVIGPGDRGGLKLGHWAKESWTEGEDLRHELYICADRLDRDPSEIFETLVHEAAHAIATARGVKDHSGQRHNLRFKAHAEELGLKVEQQGSRAWARTSLLPETAEAYAGTIEAIGSAVKAYRRGRTVVRDAGKARRHKVSSAKSMMRFLAEAEPEEFRKLVAELGAECPNCGGSL